jgi:hypothetical protein
VNWDTEGVDLLCLCYVENASAAQIRYAVRRIRRKASDVRIIVALLGDAFEVNDGELPNGVSAARHTTAETIDKILALAIDKSTLAHLGQRSVDA